MFHTSVLGLLILVVLCGAVAAAIALLVFWGVRLSSSRHAGNPNLHPCPDCGRQISVRATTCPHCGGPVKCG
jgi:hypothetical protein